MTRERPNMIFIITDQMRWDCMSGAGHPVVETPNLDELAHKGVRFDVSAMGDLPADSDFAIHLPYRFGGVMQMADREMPLDNRSTYSGACGETGPAIIGPLRIECDALLLIF